MGATIYNELPIQVRRIESFIAYEKSLNQHFSWTPIIYSYTQTFYVKDILTFNYLFLFSFC